MHQTLQHNLTRFSLNECKNLCEDDGERIPSVLEFDFDMMKLEFQQPLQSRDAPSLTRIWTDGKFDYDQDKWTDSADRIIPDHFWENYTLSRKAYSYTGHQRKVLWLYIGFE